MSAARAYALPPTIERVSSLPVPWRRPSAQAVDVLLSLTESDLRARYGRGGWQLVKWLVDPFALVGVYLLLVTFILRRGGEALGLSLSCAVIPFQLVMMSIVNAMGACTSAARSSATWRSIAF